MRTLSIRSFKLSSESRGRFFTVAVSLLAFALPAFSQSAQPAPAPVKPQTFAFDVVSVRPSKPGCAGMSIGASFGRFSARCTTLWGLLYNAFPVRLSSPFPGLPGWADSAAFDVEAKMDDETLQALQKLPAEQQGKISQQMRQAILADRFQLRIHHETREGQIYKLILAKSGFKLKEAPASDRGSGSSWGRGEIKINNGPLSSLAFTLGDILGHDVIDQTGRSGNYDIALHWTPDEEQGTSDAGPTLFTAIEEQLGLKLVSAKGPVDVIVVDHVEKPSAN
jgi:uncharacterized protein (TIGR03435 family)